MATLLTRDEILLQGLDRAYTPLVSKHDIVDNVIQPQAWSIGWLTSGLNLYYRLCPFSTQIQEVSLTIPSGTAHALLTTPPTDPRQSLYLPQGFIIDVRNGLFVTTTSQGQYNLARLDYSRFIRAQLSYQNLQNSTFPYCYTVAQGRYKILPTVETALLATAHCYVLPTPPEPDDYVDFPDEETLVEYIRIKALEWSRHPDVKLGAAQAYMKMQIAWLRSSGLLNEGEYDQGIPLENNLVTTSLSYGNNYTWMGNYAY